MATSSEPSDVVIEDGRVLIEAVKRFQVKGIGIERISALRLVSRFRIWRAGLRTSIRIEAGNFFNKNLSSADVVSFYLLPETNARLIQKLQTELKPGSLVVFHRHPVPGLRLESQDEELKIFVARI